MKCRPAVMLTNRNLFFAVFFQGTFEADEDRVVRIKYYQFYGFGQFPKAVVFDKIDIVGNTIHPFYR